MKGQYFNALEVSLDTRNMERDANLGNVLLTQKRGVEFYPEKVASDGVVEMESHITTSSISSPCTGWKGRRKGQGGGGGSKRRKGE